MRGKTGKTLSPQSLTAWSLSCVARCRSDSLDRGTCDNHLAVPSLTKVRVGPVPGFEKLFNSHRKSKASTHAQFVEFHDHLQTR